MSLQRLMHCQAGDLKCDYPSDLQTRLAYLEASANQVRGLQGGVNYKRWGRTSCPYGSDILYKGYAAKNAFNSRGGGSNFLCLPEDPEDPPNVHPGLQGIIFSHSIIFSVVTFKNWVMFINYKSCYTWLIFN